MSTAIDRFVTMYEPHEAREDTVVFPALYEISDASTLRKLGAKFAELQDGAAGDGGLTAVLDQVVVIEQQLGIDNLANFTPAL